jgi:flagellar hook-length control protein FliK
MNLPTAESLGPTTVLDAIAPAPASAREESPQGGSFHKLLSQSPLNQSPPSRGAKANCSETDSSQDCAAERPPAVGSEVDDAEVDADRSDEPAASPGDGTQANTDDALADESAAGSSLVIVAAAVALPSLPGLPAVENGLAGELPVNSEGDGAMLSAAEFAGNTPPTQPEVVAGEVVVPAALSPTSNQQPSEGRVVDAADPATSEPGKSGDSIVSTTSTSDQPADDSPTGDRAIVPSTEQTVAALDHAQGAEVPATPALDASQSPSVASSPSPAPQATQSAGRLPTDVLVDSANRPVPSDQSASVDSARLIHRVARAFAVARDGGEVRLRLSPPELGALRLDVRVQDGVMVARLEAETSAARTALIDNLPALRERLAEQGVRIERFDVDLMRRDAAGNPDRPADRQPPEQPAPHAGARSRRMPQVAEGVIARSASPLDHDLRRLNVIV